MQFDSSPARQARTHYRHELNTLTYVTLDAANGGIVRNLNSDGVAVQAVAALRPEQRVRVRFELRSPRLRVETYGQVSWTSASGRCGIRFMNLPTQTRRQIDEWIFSNLLDAVGRAEERPIALFGAVAGAIPCDERLLDDSSAFKTKMDWLSRRLSGRTLAGLVDGLVMVAGLLLFALVFLSITHELPPWPITLGAAMSAAVFVAGAYWAVFAVFGGASLGSRLAQTGSGSMREGEAQMDPRASAAKAGD
jgi:hypothetical protein